MNPTDNDEHSSAKKGRNTPAMKTWNKPEIRDQSIRSLTEGKPFSNPTEVSPSVGS